MFAFNLSKKTDYNDVDDDEYDDDDDLGELQIVTKCSSPILLYPYEELIYKYRNCPNTRDETKSLTYYKHVILNKNGVGHYITIQPNIDKYKEPKPPLKAVSEIHNKHVCMCFDTLCFSLSLSGY